MGCAGPRAGELTGLLPCALALALVIVHRLLRDNKVLVVIVISVDLFSPSSPGRLLHESYKPDTHHAEWWRPIDQPVNDTKSAQSATAIFGRVDVLRQWCVLWETERLDETARFLESRMESYNVHAHSTRLLWCSEVSKGWHSEVI